MVLSFSWYSNLISCYSHGGVDFFLPLQSINIMPTMKETNLKIVVSQLN